MPAQKGQAHRPKGQEQLCASNCAANSENVDYAMTSEAAFGSGLPNEVPHKMSGQIRNAASGRMRVVELTERRPSYPGQVRRGLAQVRFGAALGLKAGATRGSETPGLSLEPHQLP
jgi:hypothetical protein